MEIPITQSRAWEKLQHDLGEETFYEKTDDYQFLAVIKHTRAGNYLFVPYGPLAKNAKSFKKALEALTSLAKSKSVIFIRIEPRNAEMAQILPHAAKKVHDINPADTWVVDISDASQLNSVFPRRMRGYYNGYAAKGIEIVTSHDPADVKHLADLQAKTFRSKHITPYSAAYLATELSQDFATLYLAKYQGQVIAAVLVFDFGTTRFYMQAASDKTFAKLNANGILTIQSIYDANKKGIKQYDFWGIAPDDAPAGHPWAGFTSFKKSFAGAAIHYAGTYDIVINPFRYRLFNLAKKLLRTLHPRQRSH